MKCPKLKKWFEVEPGQFFEEPLDCLKEECAWWDEASEKCAMVSVIPEIISIAQSLTSIERKMPHAGQFLT